MVEVLEFIKSLFINRNDCWADAYLQPNKDKMAYTTKKDELTDTILQQHLNFQKTIGVYQLNENKVKWACLDFDLNTLEDFENAKKLYSILKENNLHPLLEMSGGGDFKCHIWIFCDCKAKDIKYYLESICEEVKIKPHEIFPKQLESNEKLPYGNLVKLPLGLHLVTKKQSVLLDENFNELKEEKDIIQRLRWHNNNIDSIPKVIVKEKVIKEYCDKKVDVSEYDRFFEYVRDNELPDASKAKSSNLKIVGVNDNILKNYAIYLFKKGYDEERLEEEIRPIYEKRGWRFSGLKGWWRKARDGFDNICLGELVEWCKVYKPDLISFLPIKKRPSLEKAIKSYMGKEDLAERFYEIQPIYFDNAKIFWIWNFENYYWERVDETDILNKISEVSNWDTINSTRKNEILEALKQLGRKNKPQEPKTSWVQFKDKIVDIETGGEFKASHHYFITNPIPWELGNSEDTPLLDKLFVEWVGEKYKQTLYETIAYCIYPHMRIHRVFGFIGTGRNGKSTCIRLIEKLVGGNNISSVELEMLNPSNRFGTSALYKKLVVVIGEIDKGIFNKTSTLKAITGDELIRIEFKGKDLIETHNYAKPIIATNHLPETDDKTAGFYSRWVIIKFPNLFLEEKPILENIPEEEFKNLARKSIRILQELFARGNFTLEGNPEDKKKQYESYSNPITEFIKEYCDVGVDCKVKLGVFAEHFNVFLKDKGKWQFSPQKIANLLNEAGFEIKKENIFVSEKTKSTANMVLGIKLRMENDENVWNFD